MSFPSRFRLLGLSVLTAGFCLSNSLAQPAPPKGQGDSSQPPQQQEEPPVNFEALDGMKGYGGLEFNSDFSAAKDLVLEKDYGPLKIYYKKDSKLALGPALLETILYYYYEGKLYGIAFHTNDGQDTLNLLSVFHFAFGPGNASDDDGPSTIWLGKKNGALFDINTSSGDGSAFIFDHKLHDAYLKYESESAQKAAQQLIKGE